jgi:hypothetical protein
MARKTFTLDDIFNTPEQFCTGNFEVIEDTSDAYVMTDEEIETFLNTVLSDTVTRERYNELFERMRDRDTGYFD